MAKPELQYYLSNEMPHLNSMSQHFRSRFIATGSTEPIHREIDQFGNTVLTSRRFVEPTLTGLHPATMVISPFGQKLLQLNPHLTSRIQNGQLEAKAIQEGTEGRVYRVELQTPNGSRDFAIKYTFPIDAWTQDDWTYFYTPCIDQMRLLQQADRSQPVPGLSYIDPALATLDYMVSPYVEGAYPIDTIRAFTAKREGVPNGPFSDEEKRQLAEILDYDTRQDTNLRFLLPFYFQVFTAMSGLKDWLKIQFDQQTVPLISNSILLEEADSSENLVIAIGKMHELFQDFLSDPYLEGPLGGRKFVERLKGCCTAVELTAGCKAGYPKVRYY